LLLLAGSVPCRSVRACMCAVHARAFLLPCMIQLARHVTNQLLYLATVVASLHSVAANSNPTKNVHTLDANECHPHRFMHRHECHGGKISIYS
jgi:hypothetical protein